MRVEREHGDNYQIPAEPAVPTPSDHIYPKASEYVQTVHGVIDYPVSAPEYHSRSAYDFLDEVRATITTTNVLIDFGRIIKVLWIKNTDPDTTGNSLYVNFNGGIANAADGCVQIISGETRSFVIPVRRIYLIGGGATGYRVTWGF